MKVLYLGYWPAGDGLTQSVIIPRLQILSGMERVETIYYCSVERGEAEIARVDIPKVIHVSFQSRERSHILLTKLGDFRAWIKMIHELVSVNAVGLVICNSPLAGIVGYYILRMNRVPYVVECYEPHSEYMREVGVWKGWDPRYWTLTYFERKQKQTAAVLATVSELYTRRLLKQGVPAARILTVPNCVPTDQFKFDEKRRSAIRSKFGIAEGDTVGIYVGKFGGIYYDDEAFDLFAKAFGYFGSHFWLIIVTPESRERITQELSQRNLPLDRILVEHLPRSGVPDYLSAADFAFSTIRPSPARAFCCPIKNGEYWANGLPVLIEEGIGEDSAIVRDEGGGIVFEAGRSQTGFQSMAAILKRGRPSNVVAIEPIAFKHRRMAILIDYYDRLLALIKQ